MINSIPFFGSSIIATSLIILHFIKSILQNNQNPSKYSLLKSSQSLQNKHPDPYTLLPKKPLKHHSLSNPIKSHSICSSISKSTSSYHDHSKPTFYVIHLTNPFDANNPNIHSMQPPNDDHLLKYNLIDSLHISTSEEYFAHFNRSNTNIPSQLPNSETSHLQPLEKEPLLSNKQERSKLKHSTRGNKHEFDGLSEGHEGENSTEQLLRKTVLSKL